MPLFLDQHEGGLTPDMVGMVSQKVEGGQADEFGSTAVNVMYSDNETFCLRDAPNAESVHKSHEATGVNLGAGDIRQVTAVKALS